MRLAARRVLSCAALCAACSPHAEPAPIARVAGGPAQEPPRREVAPTVVWIGGDVLLSEAIRDHVHTFDDHGEGMASILRPMAELWRRDRGAFVVVNLETPIATRRYDTYEEPERLQGPTPVHLNAPRWLATGLARAGVGAVSLANNHALDQDVAGLVETIDAAYSAGLMVTGAGRDEAHRWPLVVGEDGARVALLSFFDGYFWVPGRPEPLPPDDAAGVSRLDERAFGDVAAARSAHDAVIASVHVLGELRRTPAQRWRAWARRLVDAGADVVVVSGTHVVMPVERITVGQRTATIVWGLGNLISDMGSRATPRRPVRDASAKADLPEVRESLLVRIEAQAGRPLDVRFVAGWMHDDRFERWHMGTEDGEIAFALLPLSTCGVPVPGEAPQALRREVLDWIGTRFEHVLEVTGLVSGACEPIPWLRQRD